MALRTSSLPASQPQPLTPADWRRRVEGAVAAGAAALAAGDMSALGGIYTDLAGWDDPHRAFQARRDLTELVLAHHPRRVDGWVPGFVTASGHLLDWLERDPADPVTLNLVGVLLYELLELGAAEAIFRAVCRLDPGHPQVAENLTQTRLRKRAGGPTLAGPFGVKVRRMGARAKRVAMAAQPARRLTLSLCMIVKDEEDMLPGCLAPLVGVVDEMIVVDTGSTDRTVEVAESFGARVVHHPWNGSFSDARNVSIDAASGDWIMYLDADEHMEQADARELRELTGRTWRGASTWWRPTTRAATRPARPPPTWRCECGATAPATGSRAASTSRRRRPCRCICRSGSSTPGSAYATSAISISASAPGRSRSATSSCWSRGRARTPAPSTTTIWRGRWRSGPGAAARQPCPRLRCRDRVPSGNLFSSVDNRDHSYPVRPGSRPARRGVEIQVAQITLKLAAAQMRAAAPLRLEVGSQVVARLVSAPAAGGRGLISLAGHLLEAQLPAGLEPGGTLPLQVVRADPAQVVVRILSQNSDQSAAQAPPGTVWLPGGAAVQLAVDPDAEQCERGAGASGSAAFVLHDPALGAIEVRLALAPGGVQASVTTPSGVLAERAAGGLPDLISRLGTATGRPAAATSSVRAPGAPAPTPPQGAVDVHA